MQSTVNLPKNKQKAPADTINAKCCATLYGPRLQQGLK